MKRIYMEARETEQMEEDDFEISHETPAEVTEKCAMIREMVGCGYVKAWQALMHNDLDVVLAIDSLLTKPVVAGEKYIPKRPTVDPGMTDEQKERCDKGRWLQEQVNAVFSVAHSQTRSDPPALEAPAPAQLESSVPTLSEAQSPSKISSPPGSDEKNPQRALQSESLP